jgi:hypothetical protein
MVRDMESIPPFALHARETVTIMRPMPSVVPRGNASPNKQQPSRSIRFDQDELDAIDKAAELLNMSRSAFTKWCAFYAALDIIEQHKLHVAKFGR